MKLDLGDLCVSERDGPQQRGEPHLARRVPADAHAVTEGVLVAAEHQSGVVEAQLVLEAIHVQHHRAQQQQRAGGRRRRRQRQRDQRKINDPYSRFVD